MADENAGIYWRTDINAWWPRYDHKPVKCFEFVTNGLGAIRVAQRFLKKTVACVQAGGHAGYWPKSLAEIFDYVYTFEPEPLLFECMQRNCCAKVPNVTAYPYALGAEYGRAKLKSHVSAGSWRIDPAGETEVEVWAIDALHLPHCDAIFLDVEGYEVEALKGAAETIKRCRPLILAELLPRSAAAIEEHLARLQYKQVARFGRDGIFTL